MVPIFRRFALPFAAACLPLPALAQSFENLEMLDSRIAAALGANIGEPGGADDADRPPPAPAGLSATGRDRRAVAGALAVRCAPLGWRIRVSIVAARRPPGRRGGPARRPAPTPIVRRGDQIQLVAIASGFTVSTLAVADQDGAPGDRIRVRTERRTAPVIGQVLEDGRVALPGFNWIVKIGRYWTPEGERTQR